MPWSLTWYDAEETILLAEPVDSWTWQEFLELSMQGQAMMREKNHIVHNIYLLKGPIRLPSTNALPYFRRIYATDPPNSGLIIAVGASEFIQALARIIGSVMGGTDRFKFVSSLDEALAKIEALRSSSSPQKNDAETS